MKKISISLSDKSINAAIKELERYQKWIETKTSELVERLALIGVKEASIRFATAMYDGVNDSDVSVVINKNAATISAKGTAVCFIEFGAGAYHNPSEPYPLPRPDGISNIGEYGQGKGKRKMWGYRGEPGTNGVVKNDGTVLTRGNPAAMPMWYAFKEMETEIYRIAREVFKS